MTQALQPVVRDLVEDMRERLEDDADQAAVWRARHAGLVEAQRTGATWTDWVEDQLTQAAVGWVLTSVFVRFCEDNDLLGRHKRWISGADADGRARAVDEQERFFTQNLDQGFRGYLRYAFAQLERSPAAASLVGEHAAIHIAEPSDQAAQRLVEFWRQADAENATAWALHDPQLDTRFLGDMYQDLSEYAKKKYALLQTPEFVEEFILDRTLTPALVERRPRRPRAEEDGRTAPVDFKVIDPTCGSGHFLLGAFGRLLDYWRQNEPGLDSAEHVRLALESIHGVDINPFAVAIARFRLVVAALQTMGMSSLLDAPQLPLNVYAGDSLLWSEDSAGQSGLEYGISFDPDAVASGAQLTTEDVEALRRVLARDQYDVVVGNPPYITVKDKALNQRYRELYSYCKGTYALTVPFMEQFHALAKSGTMDKSRAGWIGQITSNSFMAREFGVPLIEEFLPRKDLLEVIDTSGAYIPGHGTPTVTLVSRNRPPQADAVRAVLGIQGEPGAPDDAAQGLVWRSIVEHIDTPGYEDQWISVEGLRRNVLARHPWSLQGGAAPALSQKIDTKAHILLSNRVQEIGFGAVTREDEVYFVGAARIRQIAAQEYSRPFVVGTDLRDWLEPQSDLAIWPYSDSNLKASANESLLSSLWRYRRSLSERTAYGRTQIERGMKWYEYSMFFEKRFAIPNSIAFAFVATHNHFVLDRGGKVFNRSAPVIKLPEGAGEDEHLELLGVLNSSTACFWLKQNSHNKGSTVDNKGARTTLVPWENFYEFTGTTLKDFPLPAGSAMERARRIDGLALELAAVDPAALLERELPSAELFARGEAEWERIRSLMVAEQEELDWQVYHLYGFTEADESLPVGEVPGIALGERAFEIALARKVAAGEAETAWFERHRSTPVTEIPEHLPEEYRTVVERRLGLIAQDRSLELLERPEYKRRWSSTPWQDRVRQALASWILDRLENPQLWKAGNGYPQPQSARQLAARVDTDPLLDGVAGALELWSTTRQAGVLANLLELLKDEAVPHLAAMRLKDSGLRKFAAWQQTWDAQRAEDRGEITTADVPVPPKYTSADFRKSSYWQARGKLDVPKERFISYPDASGPDDPTPMLGWAGWDHAEQGIALLSLYDDRKDDTPTERLVPLVAGLAEVMPWIRQWHSGMDATLGLDWADYLDGQLAPLADNVGVAVDDLANWRPAPATRGRTRAASTATAPVTES
ncbi:MULTISPECIES: BREX-2 system adenine-specific DNA-methyltransferase PglX [Dietzia]|uniref:BREX-2 system adenine-specific DNA-methyltransferase PglX n=1 Tax=Dietzia TaxID=37914 RepID=UPI0020C2B917|nr:MULTISPECIES: BREX-2 system adenine-specific DNA-methyltransferase PglX [Dietzia]MCT1711060.1 BREX-2 system adenine-specific DNA-methyltransferase PglX [Dietzia cinnamea]MCT2263115.1 BREX-2 system adenine-specific DNA-methyltransferase PglX [Dietzia cinnamea]MCT2273895.1 BREX-2 system adenine-specific DNA-methyltransferase PglX [Dietzia cinnamea]